jgi:hypothetical protein
MNNTKKSKKSKKAKASKVSAEGFQTARETHHYFEARGSDGAFVAILTALIQIELDAIKEVMARFEIPTVNAYVEEWENGWFFMLDRDDEFDDEYGGELADAIAEALGHHLATLSRLMHHEYTENSKLVISLKAGATVDGKPVMP